MKEKFLFDIQRFTDIVELASGGIESTTIDNITYTAKSGTVTIDVDSLTKVANVTGNVNISENIFQSVSGYTFNINQSATINGITYNPAQIMFGANHWIVTLNKNCTVGNGIQPLGGLDINAGNNTVTFNLHAEGSGEDTVNIGGIRYASKSNGNVNVSSDGKTISLSGNVSVSKNLSEKFFKTSGDGTISFSVYDNNSINIDDTKYTVTDAAVISVSNGNVTCAEGSFSITPIQNKSVTINSITYTAQAADTSIKIDDGNVTLTGKFTVALEKGDSVRINRFNLTADENVSFTFDSTDKNFVNSSADALKISTSYGKSFKVNGVDVTDNGESGIVSLTKSDTTLNGNYTVGNGEVTLSNKIFKIGNNEIFFNTKSGDSNLKINDATFSAASATDTLQLTAYFADNNVIKVDGSGVNISGTGNFILVQTKGAQINGIDFKSDTAYANIKANAVDEVTLYNVFTIGDGTQNLNGLKINAQSVIKGSTFKLGTGDSISIGGINYSGDGEIVIDKENETAVTLSGNVEVSLDKDETITIKGTTYKAISNDNISFINGSVTVGNGISVVSGNETVQYELKGISRNIEGFNFTGSSTDAAVTFDSENKKISIIGKVAISSSGTKTDDETNFTDYKFCLSQNSTAQIEGIDFKKTGSNSNDADIVFTAENEVTLYSAFEVGDGQKPLNGLIVTLGTPETSKFNLAGSNDSVTVKNYSATAESADGVTGDTDKINGVTYTGSGTVTVTPNQEENPTLYTVALSGGNITVSGDVSSITQFTLTGGNSYTFGATTIDATSSTATVTSVSPATLDTTTSLSNVTIGSNALSLTNGTSTDGYTITLDSDGSISAISGIDNGASITNAGGATSIATQGTGTFTINSTTYTVNNNSVTFNMKNDGSVDSISATSNAEVIFGGTTYTLSSGQTLQAYPNGTWATSAPYDTYLITSTGAYGLYAGSTTTYDLTANYSDDYFTDTGTGATITGNKTLKVEKDYTVVSNGKTYTISNGGGGTFSGNDTDGITSVDSGTITATNASGSIGVEELKDNAVFKLGDTYTYTETETASTSATITVNAENGGVTVGSGTIKKSFGAGTTFTFKDKTYTANNSTEFAIGGTHTDGEYMLSGGGTRDVTTGTAITVEGTDANVSAASKYLAVGNNSGGYTAFSGTATYILNGGNFIAETDKTYTISGNATYQLTTTDETNEIDTEIKTATGTRAFGSGDAENKSYLGDEYTVTNGTYQLSISNGAEGTRSLTAGSATRTVTATAPNNKFHYIYDDSTREYTATSDTTIKISFNGSNAPSVYEKSGGGTRPATSTEITTDSDGYTYNLDSNDKILLTLGDTPTENFHDGSATRTTDNTDKTFKVTGNTNTYTAYSGDATLTLTRNNGAAESVELTTGSGTREQAATTFTYNNNTYTDTATSGNVTYALKTNQTSEELFNAQGTRDYSSNVTYNNDSYNTTGKYTFSLNNGTYTENLNASGTYTTTNGTFHYGGKTYQGFDGGATLTISYDGTNETLTSASGKGTRAVTENETFTTSYDGNSYRVNQGATIKLDITNKDSATETFYAGTATQTYTSGSGVFHFKNQDYTAQTSNAKLTLTKSAGGNESVALTGSGTRTDDATTFTVTGVTGTYNRTSDNIIYQIADNYDEKVYNATGTRTDVTTEKHAGNWGNTYTLTEGTRTLTVANGNPTDVLTSATATNNYSNGSTFKYGADTYTATNYNATLSLSIANDKPTETFVSGSGKNSDGDYIIKTGSKADIGTITYTAAGADILRVSTSDNAITGISGGTITGNFNNQSATIGGIVYNGTGNLKINGVNSVKAESGNFEATGDFSTERTINDDSRKLKITGDNDVKVTFSTGDVTKIENLNNGANVVNAGGATQAIANENGTYTFGSQIIEIANDHVAGVTFTLDGNGIATGITGLDRLDSGDYVTVNITDTAAENSTVTSALNIRRSGETLTRNADGTWTEPNIGIRLYVVEYNGTFSVKAVDNANNLVTLTNVDYTVNDTDLSITGATMPIVVQNKTETPIKVNSLNGIESTGNNAIEILSSGKFEIGTYDSTNHIFTAGITDPSGNIISTDNFSVSEGGTFKVKDGIVKVTSKNISNIVNVTAPTDSSIVIASNGKFTINGTNTRYEISGNSNGITVTFDSSGNVEFKTTDDCDITETISSTSGISESGDLAESADAAATFITRTINGTRVAISGDDDGSVTYKTSAGKLVGLKNVSKDATIILGESLPDSSFYVSSDTSTATAVGGTLALNTKIRYNSTNSEWTCGNATAQAGTDYKVEIGSDGEIVLKYNDNGTYKQTKNVNDYKAAFGDGTAYVPKNGTLTEDDGTLPKYDGGITLQSSVSKLVIKPAGTADYTINGKNIALSGETTITSSDKFSSLNLSLKSDRTVVYDGMTFNATAAEGSSMIIPSSTGGYVTLDSNSKVTGDILGKNQSGSWVGAKKFNVRGTVTLNELTLTDLGDSYIIIDGLEDHGYQRKFAIGGQKLTINNDFQVTISASCKWVKGLNDGINFVDSVDSGESEYVHGFTFVTEGEGNFAIFDRGIKISGDSEVSIKTDNSNNLSEISGLNGSLQSYDNYHLYFTKVNGKDVKFSGGYVVGEPGIGIVGNETGISQIYNVRGNNVIENAGGATLLSTDGNGGQFTFGSKNYTLSAGTADFVSSGDTPTITEIKNVSANSTLMLGQSESNFTIGANTITNSSAATLHMGNNTIAGVENFTIGSINGLSEGATVNVKTANAVNINNAAVQASDGDYTVYAKENAGYSTITGIAAGSTINNAIKDAIIIPDDAGTYTFNGHTFKTESKPTFTMGNSNTVSSIGGVSGNVALYQDETGLKVLNDVITVTGAGNTDANAVTLVAGNGNVQQVKNLRGNVNGLISGAVANVVSGGTVQINTKSLNISDSDYTVRAKEGGYDLITGLSSGANVSAVEGNVSLVTDLTGEITVKGKKYKIEGDSEVTFETSADGSKVTNISGAAYATISVYSKEEGLAINGKAVTVEGTANNPVKIQIGGGGEILGFDGVTGGKYNIPAGATIAVATSDNDVKINSASANFKINNDTAHNVTVRAKEGGYDLVTGLKDNDVISTAANVKLVTENNGVFKFPSHTLGTDDAQITLETNENSVVTMVSGLDSGKSIDLYADEILKVGANTVTVKGSSTSGQANLTMGDNDIISKVTNLRGDVNGLSAGASVEVATDTAVNINSAALQISNSANSNKFTVHTTANGYDSVFGLNSGANIQVASKDVTLYSAEDGTYTFDNKAFTTDGDATVGFVMGASNTLAGIVDLTGTIGGNFTNSVTVNNKTVNVNVTGDTAISIVGNGGTEGISKIYGLNSGAVVNNAGGATTISTAANGKFQFGATNGHTISIGAGTADFLAVQTADYVPSITGVKNIDAGAKILIYQDENSLMVENNTINLKGATSEVPVTLSMSGDTIKGVENLTGEISGLTKGATIKVADSDVKINNVALQIDEGSGNANVIAHINSKNYYSKVTGVSNNATIKEAAEASLLTDEAGTFIFGGTAGQQHKFVTSSLDTEVTFVTDDDSKVAEIKGIDRYGEVIAVYQDENIEIGGRQIDIGGLGEYAGSSAVSLKFDSIGNITEVSNLTGSINNLPEDVIIQVADSDVTINGAALKISESTTNFTVKSTAGGYSSITGVDSGANIIEAKNALVVATAASGNTGTYQFGTGTKDTFGIGGTVTLATNENGTVTAVGGMHSGESLAVYQKAERLLIHGGEINIDNVPNGEAVTLKSDGTKISEVGNLKGLINGLATDATVNVKGTDVTINGAALKINEGTAENPSADVTVVSTANGYNTVTGVGDNATITEAANVSIVATISYTTSGSQLEFGTGGATVKVWGDDEVTISTDNNSNANAVSGFNGTLQSNEDYIKINGVDIYNTDDNVSIIAAAGVTNGISSIIGLTDEKEVSIPSNATVLITPIAPTDVTDFTINGTAYHLTGDGDGIIIADRTITGLDADARLTISAVGSFNVNTKNLDLTTEQNIVIGEGTEAARLYNPNDIDFGANTPVEDIITQAGGITATVTVGTAGYTDSPLDISDANAAVIVPTSITSAKTVNLTGNSELAIVQATSADININASGVADTIISSGENVVVTGNNKTRVMPTSGKTITYNGYDHSQSAGLQVTNSDIIAAVHDNLLGFSSSAITLPNTATVNMDYVASKVGIVNFYNIQGEMQKVGYTYDGNATIDYRNGYDHMLLRGKWRTSGATNSYLYGGSGNDTAFGGVNDYFDLGRGKNYIEIAGGTGHATVEISDTSGETTVKGFNNAIEGNDGDVVRVKTANTEAYYTNDGLQFVYSNSTLTVQDVATASDNSLYAYANVLIANSDDDQTVKTSIARANEVIQVANGIGDNDFTTSYVGLNSGVDISNLDSDVGLLPATVSVDLNAGTGEFGGTAVEFRGITSLKGSQGTHTLIGSESDKNTLEAGNGEATIWGKGKSGDLLIGNTETEKITMTTFFYTKGDGADTITNFQFDNTHGKADRISLGADVSSVTHSGYDLVIVVSDGDSLTLKEGVGKQFTILNKDGETISAVTGSNLNYVGSNAYYSATKENATLNIAGNSDVTEAIDLSDTSKYSSNIKYIDASGYTGSTQLTLTGGKGVNNTIKAANNGSTLFGGSGESGDDLLIGGGSADVFKYSSFYGNDIIQGYGSGDTIYLEGVQSGTAKGYSTVAVDGGYKIQTNSSNSLTIIFDRGVTDADVIFKLADGKTYKSFAKLKSGTADSGDLAYDYWEVTENNELIDGDLTFWKGNGESGDLATYDNSISYLTDDICTGDIKFSIAPADTVYSFSDK